MNAQSFILINVYYDDATQFSIELPYVDDTEELLASIFWECQGEHGTKLSDLRKNGYKLRSMMVGDIIRYNDPYLKTILIFFVDRMGFREINKACSADLMKIPNGDRCMGWKWLQQHGKIGLHIQNIGCN